MAYSPSFPISFLKQYHLSDSVQYQSDTFDIIYIISGKLTVTPVETRESHEYRENDVLVLYSDHMYSLYPDKNNIFIHMGLNTAFMEQHRVYGSHIVCNSVLEPNRNYIHLKNIITNISGLYLDDSSPNELMLLSNIFQLFDLLLSDYSVTPVESLSVSDKYKERVNQIRTYLQDNYRRPIKLGDLASHMYMSPQYLSKFFKQNFNQNFNQYLNQYRIEHAEKDLLYTDKKITEIAEMNGFPNIATFNRQFKSFYGVPPMSYKREKPLEPPATAEWLPSNKEFSKPIKVETTNTQSINVSVQESYEYPHNYTRLINIGYAKNLQSHSFQRRLIESIDDLNLEYVRMEGLVSNALLPRLSDSGEYYFNYIDDILSLLYRNNLTPFIELGKNSFDYVATSITQAMGRSYANKDRFLNMLEAFLVHCIDIYDSNWIDSWYFELWKLPNEPIDTYFDGFSSVYTLIKKYMPKAQVGGPGHITSQSADLLIDIFKKFKTQNLLPDYISIHAFALQYEIGQPDKLNFETTVRSMKSQQKWIINMVKDIFKDDLPLLITEFNSSLLPQTYINESCFQATYIAKNILDMHEHSDMIGYWLLDDSTFRPRDLEKYMSYGISLINKNEIPLPAYHSYSLLNKLGTRLIEKGENYCITQNDDGSYTILTYNYAHFKNIDALSKNISHSIRDVYSYFEDIPAITMNFTLRDLEPGKYHVERHLIDRFHGSLIDIFLGGVRQSTISEGEFIYKMQTPSPKSMNYLKACCIPEERNIFLSVENELSVSILLNPHNLCLFEIHREL